MELIGLWVLNSAAVLGFVPVPGCWLGHRDTEDFLLLAQLAVMFDFLFQNQYDK